MLCHGPGFKSFLVAASAVGVPLAEGSGVDSLSGGAGWVGAGLLGAVLAWLLLKHLPDKDRQLERLIGQQTTATTSQEEHCRIERNNLLAAFREECGAQRSDSERRSAELEKIIDRFFEKLDILAHEGRETRHLVRNVAHTVGVKKAVDDLQRKQGLSTNNDDGSD